MNKPIAIACDIECTSWDMIGGDLISAAFVEILSDYTIGRSAVWNHRPQSTKYFSDKAQAVHGISYWKAQTFPDPRESCIEMLEWLKPNLCLMPFDFIYHGKGRFDYRWIKTHFGKQGMEPSILRAFNDERVISTADLGKKLNQNIGECKDIDPNKNKPYTRFSLYNMAKHYEIELDHHDALSDALACAKIYCNQQLGIGTWTGELNL